MNNRVYFDNAATTPVSDEVVQAMLPYLREQFGNPSSIYSYGREARLAVEKARKKVAGLLNTKSHCIYFTSGGTESNNMAITIAVRDLGCRHIITSPIEHHAVLHSVDHVAEEHNVSKSFVSLGPDGTIDYENLETLLLTQSKQTTRCLVTLMNANNETGAITNIRKVGEICRKYDAVFHSDAVQMVGHYPIDLSNIFIHFLSASGHKFHGPKGTGILYVKENRGIKPLIFGGGQEKNLRAGTENVHGIIGFAKALETAMENFEHDRRHITQLRNDLLSSLKKSAKDISFNSPIDCLYNIVSVNFPRTSDTESMVLRLDQDNICVSGGSACSSGNPSHVMAALGHEDRFVTIRFSFSRYNSSDEVNKVANAIANIVNAGHSTLTHPV